MCDLFAGGKKGRKKKMYWETHFMHRGLRFKMHLIYFRGQPPGPGTRRNLGAKQLSGRDEGSISSAFAHAQLALRENISTPTRARAHTP